MATSFDHKGHYQTTSQKLRKAGTYSAKSSVYIGSHLHSYKYLLTALKCAISSIMYGGSFMEVVSTLKYIK